MVKKIWLAGLVVLVSSCCLAQTPTPTPVGGYVPAPAFVALTDQGRALVGGTVTITDTLGGDVSSQISGNAAGTQAYSYTVPANGVVQFFAYPDTYRVTVSASGRTLTYQVYVPPQAAGTGILSIEGLTDAAIDVTTGTSGSDFNIGTSGSGTLVLNLPSASSANRGVVTTGTQTFGGNKTFDGSVVANDGIVANNNGNAAVAFVVKTQSSSNAIFVNGGTDQIGFFSGNPELQNYSIFVGDQPGLGGIFVVTTTDSAIVGQTTGPSDAVAGLAASGASGAAIGGISTDGDAMAGQFTRSASAGTVPILEVTRSNSIDTQPHIFLEDTTATSGASATVSYSLNSSTVWSLNTNGSFFALPLTFSTPTFSFVGDTNSGFGTDGSFPCIIDEAVPGICYDGGTTTAAIGGRMLVVSTDATFDFAVNSTEFVVLNGELEFTGVSGDGTGKALCVKSDGAVGTCSDAPNGSGVCTCA